MLLIPENIGAGSSSYQLKRSSVLCGKSLLTLGL